MRAINELTESGIAFVMVTVAGLRGSVPGELGGKALVTAEGLFAGTLGGGKVEAKAIAEAMAMLGGGDVCALKTWNLQRDVGMTCGGEMTFFFERIAGAPEWHVLVFGAGHVSQALVRALASLRCRVDVVDVREDWLAKLPQARNIRAHHVSEFEEGVKLAREDSFILSITKGHATDRPVLREVLLKFPDIPYLGVIGSAAKRAVLSRELTGDGIAMAQIERLICPIGLAIGGNDPAEIAISITAQLLEARDRAPRDAS